MELEVIRYVWIGAVIVLVACAGVLGFRPTATDVFPHRKHVTAGVSCTRCHANVEKGGPGLHLPDDATCTSCHNPPHDPRPCLGCHAPTDAVERLVEVQDHLKFDHARHLGGEAKGNCMRCHVGVADGDAAMRPVMATCFNCHAHDAGRDARTCSTCHKNLAEEGSLPRSHLAHEGDWIREHGVRAASSGELCQTCHKESFCADCHGVTAPALPAKRRFADPSSGNLHRAGFSARHSLEARAQPGACATCHQPDKCASCHIARGVAGETVGNPHPRDWVGLTASENRHGREARRDPAACASCHGGAGEKLCVTCHAVGGVGGNPHPTGYKSRQPLTSMPCRMCHPIGAR